MKKWYLALIVAVIVAGGVMWWRYKASQEAAAPRTTTLQRQTVIQDVTFTGHLKAVEEATLAFELSGKVVETAVSEGDTVSAGQVLARIDTSAAQLEVAKATADKHSGSEQAYLAWQSADNSLEQTKTANARTLETKRQAVRDAKAALDQQREVRQQTVSESGDDSSTAKSAYATVLVKESAYHAAQQALEESLKAVAKSNQAAEDAAAVAQAAYAETQQASGSVAGLSSLQALEQLAAVPLTKSVLVAPFDGVITKQDLEVGEVAAAGVGAVQIATTGVVEVDSQVAETDATKLEVGMPAEVSFDALGSNDVWQATVSYVAPAAQIVEGVPAYTVKLAIKGADDRLKPGLTTNITVHAREVDGVLAVPRRAVIELENGQEVVRVLENGQERDISVTEGLLGSDGLVEVTGDIREGMEVVIARDNAS